MKAKDVLKVLKPKACIPYYPLLREECGGSINAAIILRQLLHWYDKRQGDYLYKSWKDLYQETRMSRSEQRNAIAKLEEVGFVRTHPSHKTPPVRHFELDLKAIYRAIHGGHQEPPTTQKEATHVVPGGQGRGRIEPIHIQENTLHQITHKKTYQEIYDSLNEFQNQGQNQKQEQEPSAKASLGKPSPSEKSLAPPNSAAPPSKKAADVDISGQSAYDLADEYHGKLLTPKHCADFYTKLAGVTGFKQIRYTAYKDGKNIQAFIDQLNIDDDGLCWSRLAHALHNWKECRDHMVRKSGIWKKQVRSLPDYSNLKDKAYAIVSFYEDTAGQGEITLMPGQSVLDPDAPTPLKKKYPIPEKSVLDPD